MKRNLIQLIIWMALMINSFQNARADWVQSSGPGSVDNTFANRYIYSLAGTESTIFAQDSSGFFKSCDNGTNWIRIDNGLTDGIVDAFAIRDSTVFAGNYYGGVYRSNDNGKHWTASGLANLEIAALAISGNTIFAGTSYDCGVFRSTNNGTSWTLVNSNIPNWGFGVYSLAATGNNIFAAADSGIFRSCDNGTNWIKVNNGLTDSLVMKMAINGTTLFAGTNGGGIFRSTNNGESWVAINSGLTDGYIWSFAVIDNTIFAGSNNAGGVYRSVNNGNSWTPVNSGLTNTCVRSLALSGDNIYAGTAGGGVFRRPLSEMIPVNIEKPWQKMSQQENFKIFSPSRTNHFAAIEFSLPHSEQTTAKIYNLSGHEIASLVNEKLGSGSCRFVWNTRNIAPGCYTVRVLVGPNDYIKSISVTR